MLNAKGSEALKNALFVIVKTYMVVALVASIAYLILWGCVKVGVTLFTAIIVIVGTLCGFHYALKPYYPAWFKVGGTWKDLTTGKGPFSSEVH